LAKWTQEKGEVNVAKCPSKGYSIAEPFHNENFVFLNFFFWCMEDILVWPKVVSPLTQKEKEKKSKNQRKEKVVLFLISHVVLD
jgi:hypothetical protein